MNASAGRKSKIGLIVRLVLLAVVVWIVASSASGMQVAGRLQPPPRGSGVDLAYDIGGAPQLDALGGVWYLDYGFSTPSWPNHRRLYFAPLDSTSQQVVNVASRNRGQWWTFGNEPNDPNQDDIQPVAYVRPYHDLYYAVKRADPQARLVPAGVANAEWRWLDTWREDYRAVYGRYPPIDGWNFHNYLLETCTGALDVNEFERRALEFRDWVKRIGDDALPVFLTEYGVLYGNGCCGCPRFADQAVLDYMRATTGWLQASHVVTAWAWFAIDTSDRYNGDLFAGSQILPAGMAYQELLLDERSSPK